MKGNMNNMMKQMQKMQKKMVKAQEEVMEMEFEASAGGGMVTVKADGSKKITDMQINEEVVDADELEMLRDLVLTEVDAVISDPDEQSAAILHHATNRMHSRGV